MKTDIKTQQDMIDELTLLSALIADAVLNDLYQYANARSVFSYIDAANKIGQWAQECYRTYYPALHDWEDFEESVANEYKAVCFDDFVDDWAKRKLAAFMSEHERATVTLPELKMRCIPKIVIEIEAGQVRALNSTIPLQYLVIGKIKHSRHLGITAAYLTPTHVVSNLYTYYLKERVHYAVITGAIAANGF